MELVEAEHPRPRGEPPGNDAQRVLAFGQRLQFLVHELHEAVEMDAQLRIEAGGGGEQVDETGLAAADPAPYVEAAHGLAPRAPEAASEPGEQAAVPRYGERLMDPFQLLDQRGLRGIGQQHAAGDLVSVPLARGHGRILPSEHLPEG